MMEGTKFPHQQATTGRTKWYEFVHTMKAFVTAKTSSFCCLILGITTTTLSLNSCSQVGNAIFEGTMAAAAQNQIMLVRKEPLTLGYQRLTSQSQAYPDLQLFVSKRGVPNFLAEISQRDRRYFILYYLKNRQAFACRSRSGDSRTIEFSGPYPITDQEFRLLDGFSRGANQSVRKF
jgi:hypothetical protein